MGISNLDKLEAQRIICLFLAQNENPAKPHEQLGFKTAQSAFAEIGKLFRRKKNTIKNERDAFDYYTDSHRVGWKVSLKPSLELIWAKYGPVPRTKLLQMSLDILDNQRSKTLMTELNIFDLAASLPNSTTKLTIPTPSHALEISNTGRRGEKWFTITVEEILQCLEDLKQAEFQGINSTWDEDTYREAFANLTRPTSQALGGTQTLPLFTTLAKLIQIANDLVSNDKDLDTNKARLDTTIQRIKADTQLIQQPTILTHSLLQKTGGQNVIFYGAPGSGKSTAIKNRIGTLAVTTVFHPDMQNSDFIGALKPAVDGEDVTYKFSPGPFSKALAKAYNHPAQDVYLVIEELNRAPAMAVFGELFQLLDREPDGESSYGVDFPSDEFQAWLNEETDVDHTQIELPSNLSIYASMNSADQGVYPLDTAFRRRWEQEYMPIDWSKGLDAQLIIIKADGADVRVPWRVLGETINNELEEHYAEDRLLGQWWINQRDIINSKGLVPSKLLNYLWDDLLRHDDDIKKNIFKPDIKRFGQIMQRNTKNDGKQIFSDAFLDKLVPSND
jgi:5-methylcytosine-specific restriction protein B